MNDELLIQIGCYPYANGEIHNLMGVRIYDINGKSKPLIANGGGMGAKTGLYALPVNTEKKSFGD